MAIDLDQLERLERLRANGALDDMEFEREKARLLSSSRSSAAVDWRFIRSSIAVLAVFGIVGIAALLLIPAPKRAVDVENANAPAAQNVLVPPSEQSVAVVAENQSEQISGDAPVDDGNAALHAGRCRLEVRGTTYLDGACSIELQSDGSFTIYENADRSGYFAMLMRDGPSGRGYWNGSRDSTHAQDDLGVLIRNGACWENASARVCAWS